jgi:two-component system nitrogen regulation response regulator GlnG
VFSIHVPPLRDLGEDKLALLKHFSALYAAAAGAPLFSLSSSAERLWLDYPFPGNVRELRNVVIRLVTKFPGREIAARDLESELDSGAVLMSGATLEGESIDEAALKELSRRGVFNLDDKLESWERAYIAGAMKLAGGNVSHAARLLGINRTTLYSRMAALERAHSVLDRS